MKEGALEARCSMPEFGRNYAFDARSRHSSLITCHYPLACPLPGNVRAGPRAAKSVWASRRAGYNWALSGCAMGRAVEGLTDRREHGEENNDA